MNEEGGILEGSITITYQLRLYHRHQDWLMQTRQLYNRVVWHYYQILMKESNLLENSNFLLLRILEEKSIGTKEMRKKGEEPLWKWEDLPKIPMYFRRAAINTAIGMARSLAGGSASQAKGVDCSPVFYKGMYREFGEDSIQLKLYNGKKWVWVTYPYTGRSIPKEGKRLSPTLKVEKGGAYLHVPVELAVGDMRTVRERMEQESLICAVAVPDSDCLAVCALMNRDGLLMDFRFIRGGRAREAQRRKILKRLEKSKKSRNGFGKSRSLEQNRGEGKGRENALLYQRLEQINQYYAHKISREILNYCKEKRVKVLVVPNYEYTISFTKYAYLSTNSFRWQGRVILRNLKYKAFREGIVVTAIRPYHISDRCSECGEQIQRYNEGHKASRNYYGGQLFFCPNGHRGNAALNTAKNIGRYFLRQFQENRLCSGEREESCLNEI